MSSGSSTGSATTVRRRRRSALWPTIGVIAAIVVVVLLCSQFWTEVLWYRQLGYVNVLVTRWGTQAVLFAVFGVIAAAVIWVNVFLAHRNRPIYVPSTQASANLDKYREAMEPARRGIQIALPAFIGFFAGTAAASSWQIFQLFLHQEPFGVNDPQFGIDVGFYVFALPVLRYVVSFAMTMVVLAFIIAMVTHYLYGGLALGSKDTRRVSRAARIQLCVLAAVFMFLLAANFWLDRYSMLFDSTTAKFDGPGYTAMHAQLPSKEIMTAVAVMIGILFIVTAVRGSWRLPVVGIAVMLVCALAVSVIFPAIIQNFQVVPNAQRLEATYIQRNIEATQAAYGIDDIKVEKYDATTEAAAGALREDAETTASIRLLDPTIVPDAFRQLQQDKNYYNFPDSLSVDRYEVDGELRDTVIGARELDLSGLPDAQASWVNEATVYTHGYGVVAAYGDTIDPSGRPEFFQEGIPTTGALGDYEPRIYFGQRSPEYSIVGAPEGTAPWELDYPDDTSADNQRLTTFQGNGGPSVGSFWNKLLYAVKFGSQQILFSSNVTSESQILYDRDPKTRVEKVAPYLTIDGRTYPAVVDGRIVWIVDGYTTTSQYPYSAPSSLAAATSDSLTARSQTVEALDPAQVNYIRNSVKATVDAYDGTVTLYAWDEDDPILKAWQGIFPSTLKPISQMSGELMSHVRYPEDLFKVQRQLLTKYHVTDPSTFYNGGDFWRVPDDPTVAAKTTVKQQPPYYLTLQMPGQDDPSFSLMTTFIPASDDAQNTRNILTGYLAANADAGNVDGKRADDYGTLRLLQLPSQNPVAGPGQEQSAFNSTTTIASQITLLEAGGKATVKTGNLLTLPVGGGLLYVEPIYVQGTEGSGNLPFMRLVLVGFGDKIAFAPTLDEALDLVFGGDSGASAGDAGVVSNSGVGSGVDEVDASTTEDGEQTSEPSATPSETPSATPSSTPSESATASPSDAQGRLDVALADAKTALDDSNTAMQNGDWTAYGEAQTRLSQAIEDAIAAQSDLEGNG